MIEECQVRTARATRFGRERLSKGETLIDLDLFRNRGTAFSIARLSNATWESWACTLNSDFQTFQFLELRFLLEPSVPNELARSTHIFQDR